MPRRIIDVVSRDLLYNLNDPDVSDYYYTKYGAATEVPKAKTPQCKLGEITFSLPVENVYSGIKALLTAIPVSNEDCFVSTQYSESEIKVDPKLVALLKAIYFYSVSSTLEIANTINLLLPEIEAKIAGVKVNKADVVEVTEAGDAEQSQPAIMALMRSELSRLFKEYGGFTLE